MHSERFEGRTAIVTGGASGIGRSVAARLSAEGASVSLWDRNQSLLVEAVAETHAKHQVALDIADFGQVTKAMEESTSRFWAGLTY